MEALDLILIVVWAGWLGLIALAVALCAVGSRADERGQGAIEGSIREPVSAAALGAPRRGGRFERAPRARTGAASLS